MENKLKENHKKYLERKNFYKSFGYDIEKERNFIFESSKPISGRILEVGTGKGHFTLELAGAGYSFTSIDVSEEEQGLARLTIEHAGLKKKVEFRIEDAGHLSFKDASFDVIFSINTIHHLENAYKVMDELIRVLKPKGKLILSDFTKEGFRVMDEIHESESRKHHTGRVGLADVKKYFDKKGLESGRYASEFQEILISRRR